jgi:hypothetical protein
MTISEGYLPEPSTTFLARIDNFKKEWSAFYDKVSHEDTPVMDEGGTYVIRKRPDGYRYIIEQYMRKMLNKHFPGWSWEGMPLHFLGAEWVVAQGHLTIFDPYLAALGQNPWRKYYGQDAVRIQYRTRKVTDPETKEQKTVPMEHIPENIVDIGDNCKSAATAALKVAINRLCGIGDDIYGKRITEEAASEGGDVEQKQS